MYQCYTRYCISVIGNSSTDTRTRLLEAAAKMIAAAPGEEVSLRAICEVVGVKMPTMYHFFGSKAGLVNAVIERGFDMYLSGKAAQESTGDPIGDIRAGWDAHVAFGLANPGFYTLMYGKVQPGYSLPGQERATAMLQELVAQAAREQRLIVPPEQATAHILATNIGVTLRQIIQVQPDPELTRAAREAVITAITGEVSLEAHPLTAAIRIAAEHRDVLGTSETQLLIEWLKKLSANLPENE